MEKPTQVRRRIGTFLGLTFGFAWGIEGLIHLLDPPSAAKEFEYYVLAITWSPGIAALLTYRIHRQNFAMLGLNWTANPYYLVSYLLPLAYSLPAYLVVWLLGLGRFYDQTTFQTLTQPLGLTQLPLPLAMTGLVVILSTAGCLHYGLAALGEEIGWRGLLVPELAKILPFWQTALLSGLVWSFWHYPIILFSDYNGGTPAWYSMLCFTVTLIGSSFPLTWLRLQSGTVWTGVMFHASHNLFIISLLDPLTQKTDSTRYLTSEFGAAVALFSALIGACFYYLSFRLDNRW